MRNAWLALIILLLSSLSARSEQVDVELVLAVDVSGSMSTDELRIQRRGYVEAFQSTEVHNAIADGLLGSIAVIYVEWARADLKKVIVPWTRIETAADALAFSDRLAAAEIGNMRNTSITGALVFGAAQIETNAYDGLRKVIDISGDGPNNQGGLVTNARDAVISKGVVINGLPIVADPWRSGIAFNVPDLTTYYEKCVIGGPGSFAIPVADWDDFSEVVRKKIVLELAGLEPTLPVIPAQLTGPPIEPIDCRVGERLRRLWLQNP